MARLNEPPIAPAPPAETNDAELVSVKRKFLRQNRELAKTNSQQSVRIRTLENDASRLLAENLSLREQVVQLQNTLEAQSNRPSFDDINSVKDRLEAKMQELGGLVAELGQLKKKDTGSPRCKSQTAATRRSPDERQWRSGLCLQEVENAMLPTILEGKFYPRKTMNSDEMRDMDDSQSPDIGPPPVSRFENEEPIAFDPSPTPDEQLGQAIGEGELHLPTNLEMRRKRRESGPQPRHVSLFESPPEQLEEEPKKTVRAGAKRKFSVQEDEEKTNSQTEPFRFSRRNTPAPSENTPSNEEPRPQSPERPVLGSKPVNTDPVLSPKKQRSAATDKPGKKPLPKTARGRLTITRNVQPALPPIEMPEPIPTTEINLESLPPKTPAPDDIFSPPSTEPSTSRLQSKDTPPPGELALGSQSGTSGRPSRRVRAQVSYKEPSLNTKMRRPGKELVDAVLSDQDRRTSVDPQIAPLTAERVSMKQEPDVSSWKPLGAIGGQSREEESEGGSPLRQKLDRREVTQNSQADAPRLNSAAASHAISAMIEETRRKSLGSNGLPSAKVTSEPPDSTIQATGNDSKILAIKLDKKDDLAVFDFNESSPPTTLEPSTSATTSSRPRIDLANAARSARRHSAVPTPLGSVTEERRSESHLKQDRGLPPVHKRTASGTIRSSSSSNMGLGKSAAVTREKERTKRGTVAPGLPTGASSIHLAAKAEGGLVESMRAERAASRRKSMVL